MRYYAPGRFWMKLNGIRSAAAILWGVVLLAAAFPVRAQDVTISKKGFEHQIIPGDRLRVTVAEDKELSKTYAVAGDGTIDLDYIGRVGVGEMTVAGAAEKIERLLEDSYFKSATVNVEVSEFVEGAIQVMGEVDQPRAIPLKSDDMMTLTEAITQCGGLTARANGSEVRILRLRPGGGLERQVLKIDVKSMFEKMDFSGDQYLRPRDIIVVPSLGGGENSSEFLVLGDVASPGFHPYTKDMDVIRAVTQAGGASRLAKWNSARLLRRDAAGDYTVIPIDLSRLFGAADMTMNVKVLAGDILFIPSEEQASRGQVYLLGQVAKPGSVALPLDQDITLAKTILDAGGFAKFANGSKVKILRTAPDGSKQTLIVDAERILETGSFDQDVPLVNGDVIIVPEKILSF